MEAFSLNRQALAFLVVIAVMVLAMVFLSPFLLFVLGALGVLLLVAVWLKAAVRGRKLIAPFGAAEGALALSALLFVVGSATVGGLMVSRLGYGESFSIFRAMLPAVSKGPPPGSRSVHYGDPDMNERLKAELAMAGVPFTVETREGKEYVSWSAEHDAAAEAVQLKVSESHLPNGRNVHFPDAALRKEFTDWLTRKGIKYEIVSSYRKPYVVWQEGVPDPTKQFMAERGADCRKKKPC